MNEQRLGNPMDAVAEEFSSPKKDEMHSQNKENRQNKDELEISSSENRDGDSGLGLPRADFEPSRIINEEESKYYQEKKQEEFRQYNQEMMEMLQTENGWAFPKELKRALSLGLFLLTSFLAIIVISESVQFFASLETFAPWLQWSLGFFYLSFAGFILAIMFMLIKKIIYLQQSPRINPQALKVLSERQHLQEIAQKKQAQAQDLLKKYLESYPLNPEQKAKLTRLGVSDQQYQDLIAVKKRLLNPELPLSSVDWCEDFQRSFQSILDVVAQKRIKQYTMRATVGTAASPISAVDRLVILYSSFAMIKDLLTIYHLRPAHGQSAVIFAKVIMITYLSGLIEEGTEYAVDSLSDGIADTASLGFDSLAGAVGSVVSAKTAEAALNGFFINRLGKKTMQLLQPVQA